MARYLSYDEYLARGGAMGETAYEACEARAAARVDALTHGRVRGMVEPPEAVKAAVAAAVDVIVACGADALASAGPLASFTTDGYSESYQGAGERALAANRALDREILAMLAGETDADGTPLTYAGVRCL